MNSERIAVNDAEGRFKEMMALAGVGRTRPDIRTLWATFKAFAHVPIAAANDDLLFQCGAPLDDSKPFTLSFVRQFVIGEDDAYDHMEQLFCQVEYQRHAELETLHTARWAAGFITLDAYFTHVEGLPEFQIPVFRHTPRTIEIFQDVI